MTNCFFEMKNVWARTEKERKRSMDCGSQEVLSSVYITKHSDNVAEKVYLYLLIHTMRK